MFWSQDSRGGRQEVVLATKIGLEGRQEVVKDWPGRSPKQIGLEGRHDVDGGPAKLRKTLKSSDARLKVYS